MGKLIMLVGALMLVAGCTVSTSDGGDGKPVCTPKPTRDEYICERFHGCGPFPLILNEAEEWDVRAHTGPGCVEDEAPAPSADSAAGSAGE